jgi:hypothetical protein
MRKYDLEILKIPERYINGKMGKLKYGKKIVKSDHRKWRQDSIAPKQNN